MDKKKIIISTNFNAFKAKEERLTKEWIYARIDIFMKYTMRSLKAQTNQDFTAMLKYEDCSENIIKEALEQYEKLPNNIKFVKNSEYENEIKKAIKGYDYLYLARIDSDDMYHISYVQQLHDYKPKEDTVMLINQNGYFYDTIQNCLAEWYHDSPPFYTIIYKTEEYLSGKRYKWRGGHKIAIKYPHEIIPKFNFVVDVHSTNTTTKFKYKDKKSIITDDLEIKKILREFMGENL